MYLRGIIKYALMKRISVFILVFLTFCGIKAQNLDLKDITKSLYSPEMMAVITPLNDGQHYARVSDDHKAINIYNFKDGSEAGELFNIATSRGCDNFKAIDGFILSPDESRILLQTKSHRIYRNSFTAEYYLYEVKNKKAVPLSEGGPQQAPLFSPDGNMVAFVRANNIFLVKLLYNNSESQITTDGETGKILNGIPDWVNEEEFTVTRSFDFSADSKMLAWVRYDESDVPTATLPQYLIPSGSEEYATEPGSYSYKYPVAGAPNSRVSVYTFDIKSRVGRKADMPLAADDYIPRLKFSDNPDKLLVVTLNRQQNRMDIYGVNPRSSLCKMLIREESKQYIDEQSYRDMAFYPGHIVLQSDRDGYNHLYLYDLNGTLVRQVTRGDWEVTRLGGWDQKNDIFYYTSNEGNPLQTAIYKIDAKGKKTRLTPREGTNGAQFSKNYDYLINIWSNLTTPPIISILDKNGKETAVLTDNSYLKELLTRIEMPRKELFSFTTSGGTQLNGWMVKPANFSENKRYPVIMFQYSGPGSQQVKDSWSIGMYSGGMWECYLAQKGFIVACVDGRGTGGRGREFGKCNYMSLGTVEPQDQVAAAQYLGSLPYVNKERIGIWGWSYGGYNTLMAMSQGTPVFRAGVAVAPPTDWRFYDSVYSERYMRTPKENKEGYDAAAPIRHVDKLSGKLLLVHGTADDNVHFTNTIKYIDALVKGGKDYELQLYPDCNHSIYYGSNTRYHLFNKICDFFSQNLKD